MPPQDTNNSNQNSGPFGRGDNGNVEKVQSNQQQTPAQTGSNQQKPVSPTQPTSQTPSVSIQTDSAQQPSAPSGSTPSDSQQQLTEIAGVKVYVNPSSKTASQTPTLTRWRCSKCSTIIESFYPIEKCPKCGASSEFFVDAD